MAGKEDKVIFKEIVYRSNMLTIITNAQLSRIDLGTVGQLSPPEQ
jgi:hypothetical protein